MQLMGTSLHLHLSFEALPAADIFAPGFSISLLIERIARKAPELAIVPDAGLRKGGPEKEIAFHKGQSTKTKCYNFITT